MSSNGSRAADDTRLWDEARGVIRSRKGGWVIGEAVYNHGYSMMEELVGQRSFFQVLVLNTVGRLPERRLAEWLEASFICLSWPDARIWCNQIGTLTGALRGSPVAAVAAGCLAADSRMYGPGVLEAAGRFIQQAQQRAAAGESAEQLVATALAAPRPPGTRPVIVGYARPIARGDERVEAMERVGQALGFERGPHLDLALRLDTVLARDHAEGINLAGYVAAFLADQGFQPTEIYRLYSAWVMSGVQACYAEARERPAEGFLPLRCTDIHYQGPAPRPLPPRAEEAADRPAP